MKLPFGIGRKNQPPLELPPEEIAPQPGGIVWAPISTPTKELFPMWERFVRIAWMSGLAIVLAGGVYVWRIREAKEAAPVVKYSQATQITADAGLTMDPSVSHNGRMLAYASDREGTGNLAIWVRVLRGGETTRLTKEPFHETGPDFSPDDTQIAYRSDRDGGGVYIAPVSGNSPPRLLAPRGWRPRFSPDGKWIAYFVLAGSSEDDAAAGLGQTFIIPATGGEPRRIPPDFRIARYPLWAADSKHFLFEGSPDGAVTDWWVASIDDAGLVRTRAFEAMSNVINIRGIPDQWHKDRVLFSAASEQTLHVWELPLSGEKWEAGIPRQITNGAGREGPPAAAQDGRLFFANTGRSVSLWRLRIDTNLVKVNSNLEAITNDDGISSLPTLSADGKKLAYVSNRSGVADLWVSDADGADDLALTRFRRVGHRPVLSEDGSRAIYPTYVSNHCSLAVADTSQRGREGFVEACLGIWDWSRDGRSLLVFDPVGPNHAIEVLSFDAKARRTLVRHSTRSVFAGAFSPDSKWIAFTSGMPSGESQVFVAPAGTAPVPESQWIPINNDPASSPAWSPDGNIIYYRSARDGFHCIWAQRLGADKRAAGQPLPVQHFHAASFGIYLLKMSEFRIAVGRDRIIVNVARHSGNLWTTQLEH